MEGSCASASDPIIIDCSPVKHPFAGKADKIVDIDSSPEPAKAKNLGYAGYKAAVAMVHAGSGKSAMTNKLLDNRTVLRNQDFPKRGNYGKRDRSSHSSGESSKGREESEEEIQHYNDDIRFPLFSTKRRRFEAVEVLNILTNHRDKEMKCQHQPMRVPRNAAFLMDVRFVPLNDLSADGDGTYIYAGRPTQTFRKKENGEWKKKYSKRTDIDKESDFHFIREYRHLKDNPDFHQTLYYARDKWGEIVNNLVLLQYQFDGPEHSIKALPHGNSKSGKSFTRTKPSVKRVLSEHLKSLPASEAVAKTRKDLGVRSKPCQMLTFQGEERKHMT